MIGGSHERGIRFEDWQQSIHSAADVDQLLRTMRLYLAAWAPEELRLLPTDLGATALTGCDALLARAVIASRAELAFQGDEESHRAIEQMALTMAAAATRLRTLCAYRGL
jgi:hypothetical protein